MKRLTVVLCAFALPFAGRPECGVRNAECGVGGASSIVDAGSRDRRASDPFRTPHSAFRTLHWASLTIGRLHYDGGGDWYTGPSKLPNLLAAIRQRTGLAVTARERVVTLSSPELWDVPYLYMTGHGNVHFSDEELHTRSLKCR